MTEPKSNKYYREQTYTYCYAKLRKEEMGLRDVPGWLLEDPFFGVCLFRIALDPDKGIAGKYYKENIEILKCEIRKARERGDKEQRIQLREIYEAHSYWQGLLLPQEQQTEPVQEIEEEVVVVEDAKPKRRGFTEWVDLISEVCLLVAFVVLIIGLAFLLCMMLWAIAKAAFDAAFG